jgi:imidazolonepropionase
MIADYLIRANRLVTPQRPTTLGGDQTLRKIEEGGLAIKGHRIVKVGRWDELKGFDAHATLDFSDYLVTPGLIDPHTHLVFAGNRSKELLWKLEGLGYKEIASRGGGINLTVRETRSASEEELFFTAMKRYRAVLKSGVTTLEAKTGYGLSVESELRLLAVLNALKKQADIRVIRTLLSAHALPDEFVGKSKEYIRQVVFKTIDSASEEDAADFVDVFCEPGYFSTDETREILRYASLKGFGLKVHADEFENSGGAELAAELGVCSADHLGRASREGLVEMGRKGVVAVLLPLLFHATFLEAVNVSRFRGLGLTVALGTDFNPNCPIDSQLVAMNHACYRMRMRPDEALCASTVNAAKAVGLKDVGILEPGRCADIAVFDVEDEIDLVTRAGKSPLVMSMSRGQPVLNDW